MTAHLLHVHAEDVDVSHTSPANHSQVPLFPLLRFPQCDDQWMAANGTLYVSFVVLMMCSLSPRQIQYPNADLVFISFGTSQNTTRKKERRLRQSREFRNARKCKLAAKRALKNALHTGKSEDEIKSLIREWHRAVRSHSKVARSKRKEKQQLNAERMNAMYDNNFWTFCSAALDGKLKGSRDGTTPSFSESSAYDYFSKVYDTSDHDVQFSNPSWLHRVLLQFRCHL